MTKKPFKPYFLLILLYLILANLHADETNSKEKKHRLSIAAIFKNEAKHLKEWIEYHKIVGVDHFYLYNNDSNDRYRSILTPYIAEGSVTLINWSDYIPQSDKNSFIWALGAQIPAYEHAKMQAQHKTTWLVFLDIEEFLVPINANTLLEVLNKYHAYPGVTLESDYFITAKGGTYSYPKKLRIETLAVTEQPEINVQRSIEKTIFKPDQCEAFYWPPYRYAFKDNQKTHNIGKGEIRINHYVHGYQKSQFSTPIKSKLKTKGSLLSKSDIKELLNEGYEIEDTEKATYRFLPQLLKTIPPSGG